MDVIGRRNSGGIMTRSRGKVSLPILYGTLVTGPFSHQWSVTLQNGQYPITAHHRRMEAAR